MFSSMLYDFGDFNSVNLNVVIWLSIYYKQSQNLIKELKFNQISSTMRFLLLPIKK